MQSKAFGLKSMKLEASSPASESLPLLAIFSQKGNMAVNFLKSKQDRLTAQWAHTGMPATHVNGVC